MSSPPDQSQQLVQQCKLLAEIYVKYVWLTSLKLGLVIMTKLGIERDI